MELPHQQLERAQESPGKEFAALVFAKLKPGEFVIPGPPKTYEEAIRTSEFRAAALATLKEFAVSGVYDRGRHTVRSQTDLDGKVSLGLLELAGFDVSKVEYVKSGQSKIGFMNLDTGYVNGVYAEGDLFAGELEKVTAWCDNHGTESKQGSSSAEFMYQALTELGFLEKNEALDRLIDFTNRIESGNLNWETEFWRSDETVVGLARFMNIKMLADFFSRGQDYTDAVPPELLARYSEDDAFIPPEFKNRRAEFTGGVKWHQETDERKRFEKLKQAGLLTLAERVGSQREIIEQSWGELVRLEQDGFVVPTHYGRAVVQVPGYDLWGGYGAAYAYGADVYVIWNPGTESFMVSLRGGKLPDDFLPQGLRIRDHLWIKSAFVPGRVTVSLREILLGLGVKGSPTEAVRRHLDGDEAEGRGRFRVFAQPGRGGQWVTKINGVFSLFPRGWSPRNPRQPVFVRVSRVLQDKNKRDLFILEPEPLDTDAKR